jgi:hypothetical protein
MEMVVVVVVAEEDKEKEGVGEMEGAPIQAKSQSIRLSHHS